MKQDTNQSDRYEIICPICNIIFHDKDNDRPFIKMLFRAHLKGAHQFE